MSYDLGLYDPATGEPMHCEHRMQGGTFPLGGATTAEFNITYNYARHFHRVFGDRGIRFLYGMTGEASIPPLAEGIALLKGDIAEDYWAPTEGNARAALMCLLTLAFTCPTGVWKGD